MSDARPGELAALVALLRARPDGITWSEITVRAIELGSAIELWSELQRAANEATLIDVSTDRDPIEDARAEVAGRQREGLTVVTVLQLQWTALNVACPAGTARNSGESARSLCTDHY